MVAGWLRTTLWNKNKKFAFLADLISSDAKKSPDVDAVSRKSFQCWNIIIGKLAACL